jgi:ribonuclease G
MTQDKKICISVEPKETRAAVLAGNRLEAFYAERAEQQKLAGSIYLGRVKNIAKSIDAAFVDIGLQKEGFLYVDDITRPALHDYDDLRDEIEEMMPKHKRGKHKPIDEVISRNQEVMVQVVKEAIGTKGPRLSTHIALPGKFIVLMPFDKHIGVSKKISDSKERGRIKEIFNELHRRYDYGVIARTQSAGISKSNLVSEYNYLAKQWRWVEKRKRRSKAPSRIHQDFNLPLRLVRDIFDESFGELIINSKQEYKAILKFLKYTSPKLSQRVKFYRQASPLFENLGIEGEIEKIFDRNVPLKGGGYLVFDEAEGLVAIDVNTGGGKGQKGLEQTIFRTNMEAATEIARQLRLRDVGGIIVIDFIDMRLREHKNKVMDNLKRSLSKDHAKTNVLGMSDIGLVEMTRQRIRKSVESVSYQKCPYCGGRGLVKSLDTMAILAVKKLEMGLKGIRARQAQLNVHPALADYLQGSYSNLIKNIERKHRLRISVKSNSNFHIEDVNLVIL